MGLAALGFGMICAIDGGTVLMEEFNEVIHSMPSTSLPPSSATSFPSTTSTHTDTIAASSSQPLTDMMFQVTYAPFKVAGFLYWVIAIMILRGYRQRLGKYKFWTAILLPVATFTTSLVFFGGYTVAGVPIDVIMPLLLTLYVVFLASIFFLLARNLSKYPNRDIIGYLNMSGFGFIVFALGSSSPVYAHSQGQILGPPFAVIPWSLEAIGALMFSFGFYFSATAISQDTKLRRRIREIATKESQLFDIIGTANMEKQIVNNVITLLKAQNQTLKEAHHNLQHEEEESNEDQMRTYVEEIVEELSRKKKK